MKYKLAERVSLTKVDDESVLLDLDSGAYYGLNHIGTQFLQLITDHGSAERAINEISARYQIQHSQVENDINELIAQLHEKELIHPSTSE